jgi:phosphoglycolate phosphatase
MPRPLEGIAVLFDLDGTLIDTAGDLAASLNHALVAAGLAPTPLDRVRHLVGHGARAMIEKGLADAGAPAATRRELDEHLTVFLAHYERHLAVQSRPFPGALDAIAEMRADGATIAICTNKREALARALIKELGLAGLFAAIHGPDTTGFAKPDPRPLHHCLAAADAARGVFIGDSDTDIRAAKAAGMPCLAALFGYGPLDLSAEAFALFSSYQELPALVRRAAGGVSA